jgi:uncharacterized membrane protein
LAVPTSRLEAFSDGVFAIAITLLIIEVRPPDSAPGELAGDLVSIWPSYAAYVVSFVVMGSARSRRADSMSVRA